MATSGGQKLSDVLASNLRRLRLAAGLTQQDVADRMRALGHPTWKRQDTVSTIERRQRDVPVDELASLALALGVSPVELLTPEPGGTPLDLGLPAIAEAFARVSAAAWFAGTQELHVTWDGNRPTGVHASQTSGQRGRRPRGRHSAGPGTPEESE